MNEGRNEGLFLRTATIGRNSRDLMEAAGVDHVRRGRRPKPTWLPTAPTPDRASEASEGWWRRRESNTKLAICRQVFNSLTVRELWSQPVDVPPLGSISFVYCRLLGSSEIHPGRGDILEAAGTAGARGTRIPIPAEVPLADRFALPCAQGSSWRSARRRRAPSPRPRRLPHPSG